MKLKKLSLAVAMGAATLAGGFSSLTAYASSHSEAPFITEKRKVDGTDFYMFRSYEGGAEDNIVLIANYIPLQEPEGGPNYFSLDPDALYEIHIDNDGDAIEDITFQFDFNNALAGGTGAALNIGNPDIPAGQEGSQRPVEIPLKFFSTISRDNTGALNFLETYRLTVRTEGRRNTNPGDIYEISNPNDGGLDFVKPFDYAGEKTFGNAAQYEDYASQYVYSIDLPFCGSRGRVFVGQRQESFVVSLGKTFDLVNYSPILAADNVEDPANNDLADKNITSIALEIPRDCLNAPNGQVIGGWTTASLRQASVIDPTPSFTTPEAVGGAWVQVSRLSNPLVNEVVIGLKDKDRFNASEPKDDLQFAEYVQYPTLPAIISSALNLQNIAPTNFPRNDLVAAFLTGIGLPGVFDNRFPEGAAPAEMVRLDTSVAATPFGSQSPLGVLGGDPAGFPNGRRLGDDVVDIALRVVMGALCGVEVLNPCGVSEANPLEQVAPLATAPLSDLAPIKDTDFGSSFPFLNTPLPGSRVAN